MTTIEMESRLSAIERELAQIKAQVNSQISSPSADKNGNNSAADTSIARDFASLAQSWHRETLIQSDPAAILTHPAYYRIIAMGPPVLPYIFHNLKAGGGHWFVALQAITGDNPVPPEHERSVSLMRQDWLEWAKSKGLLND